MTSWEVEFRKALEQDNLPAAVAVFEGLNKSSGTPFGTDKGQALRILLLVSPSTKDANQWARRLLAGQSAAARDLGAMLVATFIGRLFQRHPQEAEELALRIAGDSHWEVREGVSTVLFEMLKANFGEAFAMLLRWGKHPSENVRRAVVLAVKKAGKERQPEWGDLLFDLLEPLMADRSEYVRKNLGPFAIGDGMLRYYPEVTLERLVRLAEEDDEQVRWNVAMVFTAAEGAKHLEAALPILERLVVDERRYVWRAVASAMRNLGRRAPERVMPVLEEWLKDERRARAAEVTLRFLG